MKRILFLSVYLTLLVSCKKQTPTVINIGTEYYPSNIGFYKVFKIDSLVYNDFTISIDTFQYYLKETLVEEYSVQNEIRTKVIEQKKQSLNDSIWQDNAAWSFQKDSFLVEENKNNLPKVVLVFPFKEKTSWNSNVRNTLRADFYTVLSIEDETINNISLDNVATIEQLKNTDPLEINVETKEVKFAPNIGLVHSKERRTKKFTTGEPGSPAIDSGFVITKQIVQFGYN